MRRLTVYGVVLLWPKLLLAAPGSLTLVHPPEGLRLPNQSQIFAFGAVPPGSTVTVNGQPVSVYATGSYFTMVSLQPGDNTVTVEAIVPSGANEKVERHVTVAEPFRPSPTHPLTLEKGSIRPETALLLTSGDIVRVTAQGSPGASASFSIHGIAKDIPMTDITRNVVDNSSPSTQGLYEGAYLIQPRDSGKEERIEVTLKSKKETLHAKAAGQLTIDRSGIPRVGIVKEDIVAVKSGVEGGYDMFLYKGMRVRLTGKIGNEWRIHLSSLQSGWVRESALQLLPEGAVARTSVLPNITVINREENTLIKIPLQEKLPYRVEQSLDPMQLVITFYGAVANTDLIRYDPLDPLIRQIRWRQLGPETCQVIIEPRFKTWWGFDTRYEGNTFIAEVRKPWTSGDLQNMIIAIDPGHGGTEIGATSPRGLYEKDANLQISLVLKSALEKAGAKPFLTRETDDVVPLYERPKIAFAHQARLFVSVHCNAAGTGENPLLQNGYSIYWYHPQSQALARAVHARYGKALGIPDRGLFYADFAVCRMTQMPAILTEQAYLILPEQEALIYDASFQKSIADAIVRGLRDFVSAAKNPIP